jgi:hypothetical protein
MGIGGGINGGNSGYIGVVTIVDYFSTLSELIIDIFDGILYSLINHYIRVVEHICRRVYNAALYHFWGG